MEDGHGPFMLNPVRFLPRGWILAAVVARRPVTYVDAGASSR